MRYDMFRFICILCSRLPSAVFTVWFRRSKTLWSSCCTWLETKRFVAPSRAPLETQLILPSVKIGNDCMRSNYLKRTSACCNARIACSLRKTCVGGYAVLTSELKPAGRGVPPKNRIKAGTSIGTPWSCGSSTHQRLRWQLHGSLDCTGGPCHVLSFSGPSSPPKHVLRFSIFYPFYKRIKGPDNPTCYQLL